MARGCSLLRGRQDRNGPVSRHSTAPPNKKVTAWCPENRASPKQHAKLLEGLQGDLRCAQDWRKVAGEDGEGQKAAWGAG